jgi:hypothetical protein
MTLENSIVDPEIRRLKRLGRLGREAVVVHLGNVGLGYLPGHSGESDAEKTLKYVSMFPEHKFYGVDLQEFTSDKYEQINAKFEDGLNQFDDSSIDIISSDMAIGHSDFISNVNSYQQFLDYHGQLFELAREKMKDDGVLYISTAFKKTHLAEALKNAGFRVEVKPFTDDEYSRTYWTRDFANREHDRVFQITARKKK